MSCDEHRFLFAPLDSRKPLTARKIHIRRLYDVLQLSIHRNDLARARRAWCILVRCKEVHWMAMWTTGLHLLGANTDKVGPASKRLEYLRTMMLRNPEDREDIIKELVLHLILAGSYREALDELELYLPSFPYQDNPVLHTYAGLISLYLAQPSRSAGTGLSFDSGLLREAQSHFERSIILDPENVVAHAFLDKIATFANSPSEDDPSSDDQGMDLDDHNFRRKRVRS